MNAFKKFLVCESVSVEYVYECLASETSGNSFAAVMDKFAFYLAFNDNAARKHLARNTVMSYFGQVKNWLLDMFSQCRTLVEERVLKMGRILDKFCLKREAGGLVKKANAFRKQDLGLLIRFLYEKANGPTD